MRWISLFFRYLLSISAAALLVWSIYWVVTRPLRQERISDRVVLRVLHWGDKNEDAIVAGLCNDFERANPGIKIIRSNIASPAQLATKLQTMLAADDPPDLFYLESERVADLASKELLADVEPLIAADTANRVPDALDLSDFYTPVVEAFRYDGQRVGVGPLVGLPKDFTTVGFYYNKDLLRRARVAPPPPEGWTWDEFLKAARAVGRLPDCYGAEFVTWEVMLRIYLFTHGLDVATPGYGRFLFEDPRVVAALDQLRGWFFEEPRTLLSAKTQLETGQEPFLAGNIGMAGPYGRWKVPTYRRITAFDWDFTPMPRVAGRPPANGVLTVAWAMAKRTRHPQESWRLMKYLCGPAAQLRVCETGLAVPVLRSVAQSPCFADPNLKPENDAAYLAAAEVASYIEWPADGRFRDQMKTRMEQLFKGAAPLEPTLAAAQRDWESNRQETTFTRSYPRMPWGAISLVVAGLIVVGALLLAWSWRRRRPRGIALEEELAGFTLVSPWVVGFAIFMAFPIGLSLLLAFSRWSGLLTLDRAEWVGLDNFRELMLYDDRFRRALWVTTWYALLAVPSSQLLALGAALLMTQDYRGVGVFRAIWYLPSVLAGVGMAIVWKWVFHHESGLLNALLAPVCALINAVGGDLTGTAWSLAPPRWFERDAQNWGVPAFAIINLWVIGGTMMIYLAGLKGIPKELYEAASIDGATGWRRLVNVTLPMLSPVIFFNVIMAVIASFQIFTQVFVMTGGGPGTATHFYVFYVYKQAFDLHQMGYASAMAWLLLLIVLALTLLTMKATRRFVHYEGLAT